MNTITLENQTNLLVKGAKKVVSSTQSQSVIALETSTLVVSGANLEVKKLDLENGVVEVYGKIANLKFSSTKENTPFFKRLFK